MANFNATSETTKMGGAVEINRVNAQFKILKAFRKETYTLFAKDIVIIKDVEISLEKS